MEESICGIGNCGQLVSHFCICQPKLVLVCPHHMALHQRDPGVHHFTDMSRQLDYAELAQLFKGHEHLQLTQQEIWPRLFTGKTAASFLLAKEIVRELVSAQPDNFDSRASFNFYSFANQHATRSWIISLFKETDRNFEELLLNIVFQTRRRKDITVASANAITILNQLEYCFAGKEFSSVKIAGANLCGANLMGTDFRYSDLTGVQLYAANLTCTNFERATLVNSNFGVNFVADGNSSTIQAVCFSPDRKLIGISAADNTVTIWSIRGATKFRTFQLPSSPTRKLYFSPDSALIGCSLVSGQFCVWQVFTGQLIFDKTSPNSLWHFSENGSIGYRFNRGSLHQWDLVSTQRISAYPWQFCNIASMCSSFDGSLVAFSSSNGTVTLWDSVNSYTLLSLADYKGDISAIAFSPDGSLLALSDKKGTIIVITVVTKQTLYTLPTESCRKPVACFSPDGRFLARSSSDGTAIVSVAGTGEELHCCKWSWHTVVTLTFTFDSALLAIGSSDGSVTLLDTQTWQKLCAIQECWNSVKIKCVSPDGTMIACEGNPQEVSIWSTVSGQSVLWSKFRFSPRRFLSDNTILAGLASDKLILVSLRTGEQVTSLIAGSTTQRIGQFSDDCILYASVGYNNTVVIWEVATGQRIQVFENRSTPVNVISFSPDRQFIVFPGPFGPLMVREVESGKVVISFPDTSTASGICYSPQGTCIAIAKTDFTVVLLDTKTGRQHCVLKGSYSKKSIPLCFSPDSTVIASILLNNIMIWSTNTGEQLFQIPCGSELNETLCFLPSNELIVPRNKTNTLFVWNSIRFFKHHSAQITRVSFSRDGTLCACATLDSTLLVWTCATGELFCSRDYHPIMKLHDVSFSRENHPIAICTNRDKILVCNVITGEELYSIQKQVSSSQHHILKCFRDLCVDSSPGELIIWEIEAGVNRFRLQHRNDPPMDIVCISPSEQFVATYNNYHNIEVWDMLASSQIPIIQIPRTRTRYTHTGYARAHLIRDESRYEYPMVPPCASFLPDEMSIAIFKGNNKLTLLSLTTSDCTEYCIDELAIADTPLSPFNNMLVNSTYLACFSSDATVLAVFDLSGLLSLYEVRTGQKNFTQFIKPQDITGMYLSPDNTLIACCTSKGSIVVHRIEYCTTEPSN